MLPRTSEAAVSVYVCPDSHHTVCVVTDWELGYMVNEINIDLRKELVADWQNPSECLCQTWRNFTKVFLRYRVRNGKDGRTTRGKKRKPAINPSNNSACCGLNSSYSSLLVAWIVVLGKWENPGSGIKTTNADPSGLRGSLVFLGNSGRLSLVCPQITAAGLLSRLYQGQNTTFTKYCLLVIWKKSETVDIIMLTHDRSLFGLRFLLF